MQAWNVYNGGTRIDTVFYDSDCDADYVRRGLIDHDGYPAGISVRRCNKYGRQRKLPAESALVSAARHLGQLDPHR